MNIFSNNRDNYKILGEFNSTYWNGLDMLVFANDILLDECNQLSYQIMEQVRPYYSYNSYTATRMWHGNRIISGEIGVNFTWNSYLFSLINNLAAGDNTTTTEVGLKTNNSGADKYSALTSATDTSALSTMDFSDSDNPPDPVVIQKFVDAKKSEESSFDRALALNYTPAIDTSGPLFATTRQGFDLNILFGAGMTNPKLLKAVSADNEFYATGMTLPFDRENPITYGTGIKLIGTSILGKVNPVDDSGRPSVESWSFMARDVRILTPEELDNQRSKYIEKTMVLQPDADYYMRGISPTNE